MPPTQPRSLLLPSSAIVTITETIKSRSSPTDAHPAELIVLGVCLGIAVGLALLWYACCRARVGPLKEIQMCKSGTKLRKEVRNVHVQPVLVTRVISEEHHDRGYSTSSSKSNDSGGGPAPATSTFEAYTTPTGVSSAERTEAEVREPQTAHMYHETSHLNPSIGDVMSGGMSAHHQSGPKNVQGGLDWTEVPLGRRAVTSFTLPSHPKNARAQGTQHKCQILESDNRPREHATARAPPGGIGNWWDA